VRPRHAEDPVAVLQAVVSGRDAFGRPGEVNAHDKRIRRRRGQPSQEIVVQRVDPGEPDPDEHRVIGGPNGQIVDRCRLAEAPARQMRAC
jgi:hypothetical protein